MIQKYQNHATIIKDPQVEKRKHLKQIEYKAHQIHISKARLENQTKKDKHNHNYLQIIILISKDFLTLIIRKNFLQV